MLMIWWCKVLLMVLLERTIWGKMGNLRQQSVYAAVYLTVYTYMWCVNRDGIVYVEENDFPFLL